MDSAPVVEQHILGNFFSRLPAGGEARRIDAFHLQRTEEALRAGVVVRAAGAAHALKTAVAGHGAAEVCGGVLASPVGMEDKSSSRPAVLHSVFERGDGQIPVNKPAHRPAYHAP